MRRGALLAAACQATASSSAGAGIGTWPSSLQPFFLSALQEKLTPEQAAYIARFPVAVINHKQADRGPGTGSAEAKQLKAIAAVKEANGSCRTFFYLNSQIDFPELALHAEMAAAAGAWWLRDAGGGYVWHNRSAGAGDGEHVFDLTVAPAREAWLRAAGKALGNASVDGIFVDKAKSDSVSFHGVSEEKMAAWRSGHDALLASLRGSTGKEVVLNNANGPPPPSGGGGMGQLFERWGESPDHDGLDLEQDVALLRQLHAEGLTTLARAGGVAPGTSPDPDPVACGSGLAAFLIALERPGLGFFACEPDFRSGADPSSGWMTLLDAPEYSRPLGAPVAAAAAGADGLTRRNFTGGAEAVADLAGGRGCVRWKGGAVSGQCPEG